LRGPRELAGRRFLISRFFRLYPAYWLSLAGGLLVFWWFRGQTFGAYLILANATMLPRLLHAPLVLGVYWTLETELVFYALCWLLWRGGWLESRRILIALIIGCCAAWLAQRGLVRADLLPPNFPAPWKAMPRHLALMFWGALFRVVYEETDGFRAAVAGNRQVWLLAGLGVLLMVLDGPRGFRFSARAPFAAPSAYVVAPLLFAIWVAVWRVRWGPLAWLGRISYSFYLFHLLIAVPLVTWLGSQAHAAWRGGPLVLYIGAAFVLTTALSALVYYSVELPSIALGKRLAAARAD
jgi:peptidoglycan/LPS O-acetylase OafA/YrhL